MMYSVRRYSNYRVKEKARRLEKKSSGKEKEERNSSARYRQDDV